MSVIILGSSFDHIANHFAEAHCRVAIPLFQDRVAAGFPSPAQDYIERTLDLNELCIKHPAATFFVRVDGDSMINAGIFSGDILVVDRALEARHKDIVIANIDDEYTVKELSRQPLGLLAHNPAFAPIWLQEGQSLEIFGVVTNVVREVRRQ
ncbi:MAG: translesion error-prone DNA polymerase V autoproteolytic subunit [Oleibacter sp.]|nr:translesion error-prone DNA polymerase V autoproteolytic subunit [Thalassolituus sp.]